MYDLSDTTFISFEINKDCNLKNKHKECPINKIQYRNDCSSLRVDDIVDFIYQAQELNFNGYIAFHNYNEPLMIKGLKIQFGNNI